MFARIAVQRVVYHPTIRSKVLFAELVFFDAEGTKFLSMNVSAKHLPADIKEGKEIYFSMLPPPRLEE